MTLDDFLTTNRAEIIRRARERVATRTAPLPTDVELEHGIPVFLDQLGVALRRATEQVDADHSAIALSATHHGGDLQRMGLTVAQVVHDYGDVCQIVTELLVEQHAPMAAADFQTLNLCLDDAIAGAVTEFARQRERTLADAETERLGAFAHELRNLVGMATLSFETIKDGLVGAVGSTGALHSRSLSRLRALVDRSLAEVRLDSVIPPLEPVSVCSFVEEIEIGASIEARAKGVHLAVAPVDPKLYVDADRPTLASILSNLLQNAFKFTPAQGRVSLTVTAAEGRVRFEVEDECGGLPPGKAEELFAPFVQKGGDRSGLGLGLAIAQKAARANGGELSVRDLPGKGCVFALELPQRPPPAERVSA
jgi:signal transduction histidine kinase